MFGRRIFIALAGLWASSVAVAATDAGKPNPSENPRNLEVAAFSVLATPMGNLARYRIVNRGARPVKARLLIVGLDTPMAWPAWRRRYARRWSRRLATHLSQRAVWKRLATLRPGPNVRVVPLPANSASRRRLVLWVDPPAPGHPGGRLRELREIGTSVVCAEVGAAKPRAKTPRQKSGRGR